MSRVGSTSDTVRRWRSGSASVGPRRCPRLTPPVFLSFDPGASESRASGAVVPLRLRIRSGHGVLTDDAPRTCARALWLRGPDRCRPMRSPHRLAFRSRAHGRLHRTWAQRGVVPILNEIVTEGTLDGGLNPEAVAVPVFAPDRQGMVDPRGFTEVRPEVLDLRLRRGVQRADDSTWRCSPQDVVPPVARCRSFRWDAFCA